MKLYRLEKSQKLPITIEEGWAFFSNPENLKIITPDYMGFDIIDSENSRMYSGQWHTAVRPGKPARRAHSARPTA